MANGYNGKILYVDLTKQTHEVKEPDEKWYRTYFGGTGIISHTLLTEVSPDVDPLGPDNVMVFACSVITGAPLCRLQSLFRRCKITAYRWFCAHRSCRFLGTGAEICRL